MYGGSYWSDPTQKYSKYPINPDVELLTMDKDFNIGMGINSIHIQPISNGFIVNMRTKEDGLKIYCFQKFEELLDMLKDCGMMTLDNEDVAENLWLDIEN